jgi:hypothetical protein
MKFYNEILDTWIYILLNVQVKWSSETYYFKGLKLLDKSVKLDICVLFETYLELQVEFWRDSSWVEN